MVSVSRVLPAARPGQTAHGHRVAGAGAALGQLGPRQHGVANQPGAFLGAGKGDAGTGETGCGETPRVTQPMTGAPVVWPRAGRSGDNRVTHGHTGRWLSPSRTCLVPGQSAPASPPCDSGRPGKGLGHAVNVMPLGDSAAEARGHVEAAGPSGWAPGRRACAGQRGRGPRGCGSRRAPVWSRWTCCGRTSPGRPPCSVTAVPGDPAARRCPGVTVSPGQGEPQSADSGTQAHPRPHPGVLTASPGDSTRFTVK